MQYGISMNVSLQLLKIQAYLKRIDNIFIYIGEAKREGRNELKKANGCK
jgi:hypothetical protein